MMDTLYVQANHQVLQWHLSELHVISLKKLLLTRVIASSSLRYIFILMSPMFVLITQCNRTSYMIAIHVSGVISNITPKSAVSPPAIRQRELQASLTLQYNYQSYMYLSHT